jgi:hypothetical protein
VPEPAASKAGCRVPHIEAQHGASNYAACARRLRRFYLLFPLGIWRLTRRQLWCRFLLSTPSDAWRSQCGRERPCRCTMFLKVAFMSYLIIRSGYAVGNRPRLAYRTDRASLHRGRRKMMAQQEAWQSNDMCLFCSQRRTKGRNFVCLKPSCTT